MSDKLHPNLARIAAAYDIILEQHAAGQLTDAQALAKAEALEARDDEGVRWRIDPRNGRFYRQTALGAEEYDNPPTAGYQTHDAFSYRDPDQIGVTGQAENPNHRLEMYRSAEQPLVHTLPGDAFGAPAQHLPGHEPVSRLQYVLTWAAIVAVIAIIAGAGYWLLDWLR